MDIELRPLRSFVGMHEAGSITRAADRLAGTLAAVSMRLKLLETGLGAPLFHRTPHGLTPTPRGAELCACALGVLAAYDEMLTATRARPGALYAEALARLAWVGQAPDEGPLRLAVCPEGCVFRKAMIESLGGARQPWQVSVQCAAHAGSFAAVRAGIAVTPVASGTAPADLTENFSAPGLPPLPPVPVHLIARADLRGAARKLVAALTAQLTQIAQPAAWN